VLDSHSNFGEVFFPLIQRFRKLLVVAGLLFRPIKVDAALRVEIAIERGKSIVVARRNSFNRDSSKSKFPFAA
jgi:hypothetical protein